MDQRSARPEPRFPLWVVVPGLVILGTAVLGGGIWPPAEGPSPVAEPLPGTFGPASSPNGRLGNPPSPASDSASVLAGHGSPIRLSLPDQERLSGELLASLPLPISPESMAALENRYLQVLRDCPAASRAPEAAFRLACLYFENSEPPRVEPCLLALKLLEDRYPGSPFARRSVPRLLQLAQQAEDWTFLADYLHRLVYREDCLQADRISYMVSLADVLERLGRAEEARHWLYRVVQEASGTTMADLARTMLESANDQAPPDPGEAAPPPEAGAASPADPLPAPGPAAP